MTRQRRQGQLSGMGPVNSSTLNRTHARSITTTVDTTSAAGRAKSQYGHCLKREAKQMADTSD